ncbi:MAG: Lrp/AsnC family transcriptional regulator [Proteobacteria bacterium]|nr:Lrp/AsnC family transcriptional regulator [Pseudomonadota bacterium]MBQ8035735.1 Lrp/AsnC family transcriptional regulator [Pseudomonadota bacterium]MBQ9242709.1 Lrp/AsnC family transcriptional regulator [Pseudomonadota bacterium]
MNQLDKNILETLQRQADISNKELASRHNMAESSMLNRVKNLKEKGVIKGYRAIINPKAIGYNVQALIMINLSQHQMQSIASFEEKLIQIPEVKVGYHITGRYDYALHVVLRDIDHLATLLKDTLSKLPGLDRQETFLIFSSIKEENGYSLEYAI